MDGWGGLLGRMGALQWLRIGPRRNRLCERKGEIMERELKNVLVYPILGERKKVYVYFLDCFVCFRSTR